LRWWRVTIITCFPLKFIRFYCFYCNFGSWSQLKRDHMMTRWLDFIWSNADTRQGSLIHFDFSHICWRKRPFLHKYWSFTQKHFIPFFFMDLSELLFKTAIPKLRLLSSLLQIPNQEDGFELRSRVSQSSVQILKSSDYY